MQATQPELFMNMQQFSDLKLEARQNSASAGKAVAQQFEGLFIQMMLKDMRSAATMDKSQHSSYMEFRWDTPLLTPIGVSVPHRNFWGGWISNGV